MSDFQVIKLAQESDILENLVESEEKLQDLNDRANIIIDKYNSMTAGVEHSSFFNFNNIYFWLVLVGLLLLAFGLLFLLAALKNPTPKIKKEIVKPLRPVLTVKTSETFQPKIKKHAVKIKVQKVK
ncbi:MAG: hypothetical protein COV55_04225 [Candidatus Komeilibacteria bacterium CG11_big_fil_rev_8_21_14_0_20_36_20]|uniref:Uncharacterized protein n=1 Tax=Candidatus Komeilibacteria bacterium CG11_big_fil_rev_8_21_14_0_20_36_20 TaxID=1974477 RepID=A0A2H0NBN9_9BACT|nr:MAG: hypothetical protein COV55_04225 [Candidatus Komeilibacteria bacterium CG11_big_fil_rev_8_21_14_0_20_36_20]PIR81450.1 MAG: hypothetical protein COU21_03455 [Candidatus Komeilibacteria bacterium CG10_big_fil_rev_8_21_14_0_10_36_65]PJC55651.1 MAG: hypothetical protein CO027_00810 [Candidatus Komeilibacteria bacterium CG_4_9_14_0_2_um_filter_36_13]